MPPSDSRLTLRQLKAAILAVGLILNRLEYPRDLDPADLEAAMLKLQIQRNRLQEKQNRKPTRYETEEK